MVATKRNYRIALITAVAALWLIVDVAPVPASPGGRAATAPAGALGADFELISVNSNGVPAHGRSQPIAVSADGSSVLFSSNADNLPGPNVEDPDFFRLYVRDREAGTTRLVSRNSSSQPVDATAGGAAMSADGRYVLFSTPATNLSGPPGEWNVYRRDLASGITTLVSQTNGGHPMGGGTRWDSLSADGSRAVFSGGGADDGGIFLRDIGKGRTWLLTRSDVTGLPVRSENSAPGVPHISGNGRYVVFEHAAEEPFGGGGQPCEFCPYVYDHRTRTTRLLDPSIPSGNDWPEDMAISGNGRIVSSHEYSRSLITDLTTGITTRFDRPDPSWRVEMGSERFSRTGRFVAFFAWAHIAGVNHEAIFVHDRLRVSDHVLIDVDALSPVVCENAAISGKGAWVAVSCLLYGDDAHTPPVETHVYLARRTATA